MSTAALRDTCLVTETQWERLHRLIARRRKVLGYTLDGLQAVGGPSPKWVNNLKTMDGAPTDRMRTPMRKLDAALHWPQDTAWGLVAHDRSDWSDVVLRDEEESLMDVVDEVDEFVLVVAARLRAIPAGVTRDETMRAMLEVLGIRP